MILPVRHMSVHPGIRAGEIADGHATASVCSSRQRLYLIVAPQAAATGRSDIPSGNVGRAMTHLLLPSNPEPVSRVTRALYQADRNLTSG
jgi:hypothetical protein